MAPAHLGPIEIYVLLVSVGKASVLLTILLAVRLTRCAYFIPMLRHSCHCPQCSNVFSETAEPIKAKLHGASLRRGNESLYKWCKSHGQYGRHGYK